MDARDVILKPIVSEKSTAEQANNKYTFKVNRSANKIQIKQAIEEIFKVKVLAVNTLNVPGKVRRMGKFVGQRPDWKKAVVQVAEGQSIKIFEGA